MVKESKQITRIQESCKIYPRRIKNFLNTEVRSYAQYVLETRTMPNIMDGLRVGARKIIWAAMTGELSKKRTVKMTSLVGDTMKLNYQHGDASLATTTVNLCCNHTNKYHPLEAIGQIPSLRVSHVDTALRYLMVRKSSNIELFTQDQELLEIQIDEGEKIEPKYFLPIIPYTLLNRTSLPGFGFSFKCNSYRLEDIIDNTLLSIQNGSCMNGTLMKPEIVGIKPGNIIYNSNKNRWYTVGEYKIDYENDTLTIIDLPHDISFESFENTLEQLKEKFIINNWMNMSEQEEIRYIIKLPRGRLQTMFNGNKWKFFSMFKLYSAIKSDILNCMDEDGKTILFFENAHQLIDCFVQKRLKFYDKRKTLTIKKLKEQIEVASAKIKFIELYISAKIKIAKRRKNEILEDLKKFNLPSYVLDMKIWNLTQEQIELLENQIKDLKQQLEYIEKTTIQEMYLYDLFELRERLGIVDKIKQTA